MSAGEGPTSPAGGRGQHDGAGASNRRPAAQLVLGGDVPEATPEFRRGDRATAREAGLAHRGRKNDKERQVLALFYRYREVGRTDDELRVDLKGMHPGTVSKVRLRLVRDHLVVDSGETRPTRYGTEAVVWKLKEATS